MTTTSARLASAIPAVDGIGGYIRVVGGVIIAVNVMALNQVTLFISAKMSLAASDGRVRAQGGG